MANPTPQSMAAQAANRLLGLMQTFQTFRREVNDFVTQYNDFGFNTIWNALPTAPQNTDGSLGTADGSPNTAHPIDTRVVSMLLMSMSATALINGVSTFTDFQKFLTNQAVTTANRNFNIDQFQQG